jgi:hypothetical protein
MAKMILAYFYLSCSPFPPFFFFFFLNNIAELEREIKCLLTTMCRRRCLKEGNKEGKEETQ